MSVLDQVRIVVYRVHEKGLEVMLVQPKLSSDPSVWQIPDGLKTRKLASDDPVIKLDTIMQTDGSRVHTYAVEVETVPSVRGIIKHDVKRVTSKILNIIAEQEEGTFFHVKEAFKKVLPNEYAALKELRDVLQDRNSVRHI